MYISEVARKSILEYNQIPLWNPYGFGGYPLLGNPQSRFLSPFFPITFIFGVVAGLKIEIILHLFFGLVGMYFLLRHFGADKISSSISAVIYVFNPWSALHIVNQGHIPFFGFFYFPFVLLFFMKSLNNPKNAILSALFLALIIFEGAYYAFAYLLLLLLVLSGLIAIQKKSIYPVKLIMFVLLLSLVLSGIKFVPDLGFSLNFPRFTNNNQVLPLSLLDETFLHRETWNVGFKGMPSLWHDQGAYIGWVVMIILFIGIITQFKRMWHWAILLFLFLLLMLGDFGTFSPWNIINHLPLYNSLREPTRFRIAVVFIVSIIVGLTLSSFSSKLTKSAKSSVNYKPVVYLVLTALLLYVTADLYSVNQPLYSSSFDKISPKFIFSEHQYFKIYPPIKSGEFHQIIDRTGSTLGGMYIFILRNEGIINAYDAFQLPGANVKAITDEDYKGEYYFGKSNSSEVKDYYWSPNKLRFEMSTDSENVLIINQRFMDGWHSTIGTVFSNNKLLAVKIPAGEYTLTLNYMPKDFIIGLFLTLLGVFLSVLFCLRPHYITKVLCIQGK
jgi:hypothetical protein